MKKTFGKKRNKKYYIKTKIDFYNKIINISDDNRVLLDL